MINDRDSSHSVEQSHEEDSQQELIEESKEEWVNGDW
jgi:hypothetical protein